MFQNNYIRPNLYKMYFNIETKKSHKSRTKFDNLTQSNFAKKYIS